MTNDDLGRHLRDEIPEPGPGYWAVIDASLAAAAGEAGTESTPSLHVIGQQQTDTVSNKSRLMYMESTRTASRSRSQRLVLAATAVAAAAVAIGGLTVLALRSGDTDNRLATDDGTESPAADGSAPGGDDPDGAAPDGGSDQDSFDSSDPTATTRTSSPTTAAPTSADRGTGADDPAAADDNDAPSGEAGPSSTAAADPGAPIEPVLAPGRHCFSDDSGPSKLDVIVLNVSADGAVSIEGVIENGSVGLVGSGSFRAERTVTLEVQRSSGPGSTSSDTETWTVASDGSLTIPGGTVSAPASCDEFELEYGV